MSKHWEKLMKINTLILILASLITLSHCKQGTAPVLESDVTTETITIDENRTTDVRFTLKSSVETGFIAYPRLSVAPNQEKIIFYGLHQATNEKPKLLAKTYSKDLKLTGEKYFDFGQGPGDVGSNNMITVTKDSILISENSNHRISIYDNDWNLQQIAKHKLQVEAFVLYENASHFVANTIIHKTDTENSYIFMKGSFPGFKTDTFFSIDSLVFFRKFGDRRKSVIGEVTEYSWFCRNKEIFILICGDYRLLKFDITGKKLKDIIVAVDKVKTDHTLDDDFFTDNNLARGKKMFTFADTVDPASMLIAMGKGFVVVRRVNQYLTDCDGFSEGDYFSYQLEYLGKVKVPCYYNIFEIHPLRNIVNLGFNNGYLYLIKATESETNEDFSIEKWEVSE